MRGEQVIDEEIAHKATELMIGDVTEGIARDASLGERPVAGKTGTSENFFDAWFVGYVPQMVTGVWMGYAEGGATLEYTLDYARELNGLSGGITPAEIWKTYMEDVMAGQPIEEFEGVEFSEEPKETTAGTTTGPSEAPPTGTGNTEQPGLAPGAETTAPVTTASPPPQQPGAVPETTASVAPSSTEPSSAEPSSPEPSGITPASAPSASPAPR
jgi:penicillin-binding protein 1A